MVMIDRQAYINIKLESSEAYLLKLGNDLS